MLGVTLVRPALDALVGFANALGSRISRPSGPSAGQGTLRDWRIPEFA
jgi:hypothetical protein